MTVQETIAAFGNEMKCLNGELSKDVPRIRMLKSGNYDKKKESYLVMCDATDKREIDRIPLTIDLSFTNEF
jgi:hypothetical protein